MAFPVSSVNFRDLQSQVASLIAKSQGTFARTNQVIKKHIGRDDEVTYSRLVQITNHAQREKRPALLFQRLSDPTFFAYLISPGLINRPEQFSISFPSMFVSPLVVGLVHYHETRKRVVTSSYLFDSMSIGSTQRDVSYWRVDNLPRAVRKLSSEILGHENVVKFNWEDRARLLSQLNSPLGELPFKKGEKEKFLRLFKKVKISLGGELLQMDRTKLEEESSPADIKKLERVLAAAKLAQLWRLGISLPEWNHCIHRTS